jgi:superfamily II DNA helicase RecQ
MLEKVFGELAFSVRGSDATEEKELRITAWLRGDRPVMISKSSIMGFGLNFQHCRNMAFVGVTDSFEAYYQAVRRCWRFGQKRDVHVHVFAYSSEGAVVANLKRKERDATKMAESLSHETRDAVMQEVTGTKRQTNIHNASQRVTVPAFLKAA